MNNGVRIRNLYNPSSKEPFKLSRSKIELFIGCPRCFYMDRRLGVSRPSMPAFTLNNAVDALLKKEFDIHRAKSTAHPLMETYGIDAVPYPHAELDKWRANFTGIQYLHKPTNFLITGAIDDVWVDKKGNLIIVDYKATSTSAEITLDSEYRQAYKRQMEIYQWLFRQNGFKVSDTGYFVYANGQTDRKAFDGRLEFSIILLKYDGNDKWVDKAVVQLKKCLDASSLPKADSGCEHCNYRNASQKFEK